MMMMITGGKNCIQIDP